MTAAFGSERKLYHSGVRTLDIPVWSATLLKVVEEHGTPKVELKHSRIILRVAPGADEKMRQRALAFWYIPELIGGWERIVGVRVHRVFVEKMKTKWASCNSAKRSIRLNTGLAKKPLECLEYIVVHEMVHVHEPTHNARFIAMRDRLMPQWRILQGQLNQLPV